MNLEEKTLWESLLNFQIDEPETTFTFVKRLARENGWSIEYTERVILEYKKFIFLCTVTTSGVTPSDPVDQAWHLHLTYTNSYWNNMCKNVLKKEVHHNPTKGGKSENIKFNGFYDRTREMYKQYFNEDQPSDIWHNNEKRFSDIDFQRINLKNFWLIKKPKLFLSYTNFANIIMLIALTFICMTEGLFYFLIILGVILLVAFIVWLFNKNNNRRNGGGSGSSGSSSSGCGFFFIGCGSSSSSSSGCSSSGCSGCSSSGCSGCGGGGCGS